MNRLKIKVLRNYDGFNIDVIEEIERVRYDVYLHEYDFQRKVKTCRRHPSNSKWVWYKGKKYTTFIHPRAGRCIAIK